MNFTNPTKSVPKLEDLTKDHKQIKPLNEEEQQNAKGGCVCNEKRIRRTYYSYSYSYSYSYTVRY
jgi:hypothetical protein